MEEEYYLNEDEIWEDEDGFPECCFCGHTYLSYCCQECPSRDEPMPENPQKCKCSQVTKTETTKP